MARRSNGLINLFVLVVLFSPLALAKKVSAQQARLCPLEETYFIRTVERVETAPQSGVTPGESTILASEISREPGGPRIGLNIARLTTLGLPHMTPGAKGMVEASVTNFLPDGHLVSLQIIDSDQTGPTVIERPIIGGTGKYRGAQGVFIREPVKSGEQSYFRITFKINVMC